MGSFDKFRNPFSADDFVERVSRTTSILFDPTAVTEDSNFDPTPLLRTFESQIEQLWQLHDEVAREVVQREDICRKKEEEHKQNMEVLEEIMQEAFASLQSLSTHINEVSTKTVHVGDQLEAVNTKRRRAVEAANIMRHFAEFDKPKGQLLPPFDEITPQNIHDAADIIQKLKFIADEMPPGQVSVAKDRISEQLNSIKSRLLRGFHDAYGDIDAMRRFAHTLYPFQFIEEEFQSSNESDVCAAIASTCSRAKAVIDDVFLGPSTVFLEFVNVITDTKLKKHIQDALAGSGVQQLETLHDLYKRSKDMLVELAKLSDMGPEGHQEDRLLRKNLFEKYLSSYILTEEHNLHDTYERLLENFYDSIGHMSWGLRGKELKGKGKKPEVEDRQSTRWCVCALTLTGPTETMLSLDVAFNMIHENKRIFVQLLEGLCNDHVNYAVNYAVRQLPLNKSKSEPPLVFLSVVRDTNSLFYILQKHFWDDVLPYVRSSLVIYPKCVQKKNDIMDGLEQQLAGGLEALIDACIEWLKTVLSKEQKKTDFKPAEDAMLEVINGPCTEACRQCVNFLNRLYQQISGCLNGKPLTYQNMENVLRHLGRRFHTVLLEHIRSMTYNTLGGMLLVRDVSEYERCVQAFNVRVCAMAQLTSQDSVVLGQFVTLRELSAIVIVKAENIKQLCEEGRLASLDKTMIQSFLQLRTDFKSSKLSNLFK